MASLLSPWMGDLQFESLESKTKENQPVFNRISFVKSGKVDIWKMKQSHHSFPSKVWDSIEIRVYPDKTVSYHQLKNEEEIEYKASCIRCHSSGPRYIRPNFKSKILPLDLKDKITLFAMNLRIKSYGDLKLRENDSFTRKVPLIKNQKMANQWLDIPVCNRCHYKDGPRSPISLAQLETIKFLVDHKQMPPWPYKMNKKDKTKLNRYIYGF